MKSEILRAHAAGLTNHLICEFLDMLDDHPHYTVEKFLDASFDMVTEELAADNLPATSQYFLDQTAWRQEILFGMALMTAYRHQHEPAQPRCDHCGRPVHRATAEEAGALRADEGMTYDYTGDWIHDNGHWSCFNGSEDEDDSIAEVNGEQR